MDERERYESDPPELEAAEAALRSVQEENHDGENHEDPVMEEFWGNFFLVLFLLAAVVIAGYTTGGLLWWLFMPLFIVGSVSALICWMRYTTRKQRELEKKLDRLLEKLDKPSGRQEK